MQHIHRRGVTRRDFLKAGAVAAGAVGLPLAAPDRVQAAGDGQRSCLVLFLTGGPSHLDTWDLKPDALAEVRGPFRPIRTNVPGLHIAETFPQLARRADRFALVRSVHHHEAPIHETGQQLLQTGRLARGNVEPPCYGAVLSHLTRPTGAGGPVHALVPGPIVDTGVRVGHGQSAGDLGSAHEPLVSGPDGERERYGDSLFGRSVAAARRLLEGGVRLVTVNMFDTVFDRVTWDCHADGGSLGSTLADYRDSLCPELDRVLTALLDDLEASGRLEKTLVLAMGEFGRTPRLNPRGGRDHWPGCWTILLAGGGVRGGRVVGASDRTGAEPAERPVTPGMVAATVYRSLGVNPASCLPGPDGRPLPLADGEPIAELF